MKDKKTEGFTQVENYIIDNVFTKYHFTAFEWAIIWVIIRNTWGKKNMPKLPNTTYTFISNATNIDIRNVKRVITRLKKDNIINQFKSDDKNIWHLNCKYSEWKRKPRAELEKLHQCNNEPSAEDPGETMAAAENLIYTPSGYINKSNYLQLTKDRPQREFFKTSAEHEKALKWFEIEKGLYKPTKRDFPKEPEKYLKAIELYTKGAAALQKYIIKPLKI